MDGMKNHMNLTAEELSRKLTAAEKRVEELEDDLKESKWIATNRLEVGDALQSRIDALEQELSDAKGCITAAAKALRKAKHAQEQNLYGRCHIAKALNILTNPQPGESQEEG